MMGMIFRKKGLAALACVTALFLALDIPAYEGGTLGNALADKLIYPLQRAVSGSAEVSREDNEVGQSELREENSRLQDMLIDYYDMKAENEELRRFYGLKAENGSLELTTARVIGREGAESFFGLLLDKGSSDGIEADDLVVTEKGLVGRVSAAEEHSCRVVTILSPDVKIGVQIKRTGGGGMLSGRPSLADSGLCEIVELSVRSGCEKGDIVVTSGSSGSYPADIKTGMVTEKLFDPVTALPKAVIEPYEDVRAVSSVAVITGFSGKRGLNSEKTWIE